MQVIGTIKFVQIQRSRMKICQGGQQVYHPASLLPVAKLVLSDGGIAGITQEGQDILDVHHRQHPQSRYKDDNKISFGFSQNYQLMQQYFGKHIATGDGGENIIIEASEDVLALTSLGHVYIMNQHDNSLIKFDNITCATPCHEFSLYCLHGSKSHKEIKSALQFLNNGMRGYYGEFPKGHHKYVVQAGDKFVIS